MSFNPGTGFNRSVESLNLQPDGKIIVGGHFTSFNGTSSKRIVRLNTDGSLDTSFSPEFNSQVICVVLQPDGKIVVGGGGLVRLNTDGSLDTSFAPWTVGDVRSLALQPDGKIIVCGGFTSFYEASRNRILRLRADGSLDTSFDPKDGFNNVVHSVALQPNGKIVIGGRFTSFNGTSRNLIARLNADGSLDTSFNPGTGFRGVYVMSVATQSDGKIIAGGDFDIFNGTFRLNIARLNADGSLDTSYNLIPGFFGSYVFFVAVQPNGKIIVGGDFHAYNDRRINNIARILNSGTATLTTCDSLTWIDGNTYTSSNNTATHTLTNAAGCDSVVTLNLTIANTTISTDVISVCDSLTWMDGNTYTSSNHTATHTLTNAAGCDSVVTLNLTITTKGTDVISACDSLTWIDGNTYTSSNDTATYTLTNTAGCDSVVTLNLTVYNLSDSSAYTTLSGKTITATNPNATYQWLDCDHENAPLPEETNQDFTATTKGNYAVEITENSCVDTSACVEVVPETSCNPLEIAVYPNPTNGEVTIRTSCSVPSLQVKVFNSLGQFIAEQRLEGAFPVFQLPDNSGLYFLEVEWNKQRQVHKVVKY